MNKKAYLNPTTDIFRVETASMIAGTQDMNVNEEEITSAGQILSRRGGSVWSDDED